MRKENRLINDNMSHFEDNKSKHICKNSHSLRLEPMLWQTGTFDFSSIFPLVTLLGDIVQCDLRKYHRDSEINVNISVAAVSNAMCLAVENL